MIGRGALSQPWIFRDTAHYLATGSLPPPLSRVERAKLVLMHFENLLHYRGERVALNTIRQRMSWYSPHLQPWPHLRHDVRHLKSAGAFRDFMADGMSRMALGDDVPAADFHRDRPRSEEAQQTADAHPDRQAVSA
jgi:tRNA-dihydrouridine synthase